MTKSDVVNLMHKAWLDELLASKVLSYKAKKSYLSPIPFYIDELVKLASVTVDDDAEAVANLKAMMNYYQKIVTYCANYKGKFTTPLANLLSTNQIIKTRTASVI